MGFLFHRIGQTTVHLDEWMRMAGPLVAQVAAWAVGGKASVRCWTAHSRPRAAAVAGPRAKMKAHG
jgi:hypothetical protein